MAMGLLMTEIQASKAKRFRRLASRMWNFFGLVLVITAWVLAGSTLRARAQSSFDREYLIKAAFLYNFLRFVEWPAEVLPEGTGTITVCLVGEDPFGEALESIKGKTVKNKDLVIRRVQALQSLGACQLLFVSSSEKNRLPEIIGAVKGRAVLTVGELEGFTQRGGIVRFLIESNNVRFEINPDVAERMGLKISSRLLNLAKVVK
jgi:hypothetical protein